jgi:hypothetical protein
MVPHSIKRVAKGLLPTMIHKLNRSNGSYWLKTKPRNLISTEEGTPPQVMISADLINSNHLKE